MVNKGLWILFASHSFRSGAAMIALANGASKEAVKRQGAGMVVRGYRCIFYPEIIGVISSGKGPEVVGRGIAQRLSSLIHGFIQLNQWISRSGRGRSGV